MVSHPSLDASHIQVIQRIQSQSDLNNQNKKLTLNIVDTNGLMGIQSVSMQPTGITSPLPHIENESDIPNLSPDPGSYGFEVYLEDREDTLKSPTWLVSNSFYNYFSFRSPSIL